MKKLMVLVLLVLVAAAAFAQSNIYDLDGRNWRQFSLAEKLAVARGELLAMCYLSGLIEYVQEQKYLVDPDVMAVLEDLVDVGGITLGEIVVAVDAYYSDQDNVTMLLYGAFWIAVEKCQEKGGGR